eukprot:TRINITY_DN76927_c0_g1_i1.p1 TRINITY_DN76927_c0_g1~~TRINITY_DN76927_c0_g1_i1.p1  ORF type:complete len:820 (+),score=191.52 TRINITY_DN76927_c0_g1_i1:45-2462(+)
MAVELETIGEKPFNDFHVAGLREVAGLPEGGYIVSLSRTLPLSELTKAIASHLGISAEVVSLGYEGTTLNLEVDTSDNGIVVPGVAARRAGKKIELTLMLPTGVHTSEARARAEKEAAARASAEEAAQRAKEAATLVLDCLKQGDSKSLREAIASARSGSLDAKLVAAHVNLAAAEKKVQQLLQEELKKSEEEVQQKLRIQEEAVQLKLMEPPQDECDELFDLAAVPAAAFDCVKERARELHLAALHSQEVRADRLGFDNEQFRRTLTWVREHAPLIVHVHLDKYGELLAKDTHYRSLFETRSSSGCSSTDTRSQQESRIFNEKYDGCTPFDRPKYGVLNFTNDPRGVPACHQYGRDYILLKRVRLRTSLTSEDSFGESGKVLGTTEYYAHILKQYGDQEFSAALQIGCGRKVLLDGNSQVQYKEVQFHGEVRLRDHVAALVVHESRRELGDKFLQTLEKLQAACGCCPVYWMDNLEDMATVTELALSEKDWGEEASARLRAVKAWLLQPPVPPAAPAAVAKLTEEQVVGLLKRHVPDIEDRVSKRSSSTRVLKMLLQTREQGLPNYPAKIRQSFADGLNSIFGTIHREDEERASGGFRRGVLLKSLVDSFEGCQAVQARSIERISAEVTSGGHPFERAIRALLEEHREYALEQAVLEVHPDAVKEETPRSGWLEHLTNPYRQALGFTNMDHASADRHAAKLLDYDVREVRRRFARALDVMSIIESFVEDVNQPGSSSDRRIETDELADWALKNLPDQHRIFWDDNKKWYYESEQLEVDRSLRPWLYRALALQILHKVLAASSKA